MRRVALQIFMLKMMWTIVAVPHGHAQPLHYEIKPLDPLAGEALAALEGKIFYDSTLLVTALDKIVSDLRSQGYLLASFHHLVWSADTLHGSLSSGHKQLLIVDGLATRKNPLRTAMPGNKYRRALQTELEQYTNNGYPFAKLFFDSSYVQNDTLVVHARVQKGPLILFDTLNVRGADKTRISFLQKYLRLAPGTPYSEKIVREIPARLNASGYLETTSVPYVDFYSGRARVSVRLQELEVNEVDGILGFLPGQNNDTDKLLITGQVKADLHHLFGSGKHFYVYWQNFNISSQQLRTAYDHPVLLGSPLSLHTSFQQLKQDTTFINRQAYAGFSIPLSGRIDVRFGANFLRNSLLSKSGVADAEKLVNADSRLNEYDLRIQYTHLDRVVLPTSGAKFSFTASVGQKEIIRNNSLSPALYEGVQLKTLQSSLTASAENYTTVLGTSVFVQQVHLGTLLNRQLFQNDLYRIGGLPDNSYGLRGFNQNQFYARSYGLLSLEWRFLLDQQSYLVTFADQGILSSLNHSTSYVIGFGGGLLLNVNAGFFRIAMAVGGGSNQPIDFTQPKIHFGFVNRF